jgi:hypothetical protein
MNKMIHVETACCEMIIARGAFRTLRLPLLGFLLLYVVRRGPSGEICQLLTQVRSASVSSPQQPPLVQVFSGPPGQKQENPGSARERTMKHDSAVHAPAVLVRVLVFAFSHTRRTGQPQAGRIAENRDDQVSGTACQRGTGAGAGGIERDGCGCGT